MLATGSGPGQSLAARKESRVTGQAVRKDMAKLQCLGLAEKRGSARATYYIFGRRCGRERPAGRVTMPMGKAKIGYGNPGRAWCLFCGASPGDRSWRTDKIAGAIYYCEKCGRNYCDQCSSHAEAGKGIVLCLRCDSKMERVA